jgi:heat shock protein HtpX
MMIREKITGYKLTHLMQTALLLGAMSLVFMLTGWIIAGTQGMKFALVLGAASLFLSPKLSFRLYLGSQGARRLLPSQAPRLFRITRSLAQRAGLSRAPDLYLVPDRAMNAFALGSRDRSAVALTRSLLANMDTREIAGILGHEITHIKNNDTGIMGLAGLVNRLTGYLSLLGQLLFILFLPATLLGRAHVSLVALLFLVFAPSVSSLLQLALSRTREFEADLGSSLLTGDPLGLASALVKLERQRSGFWRRILLPGWGRSPSLLMTHPPTKERIQRLLSVEEKKPPAVKRYPLSRGVGSLHYRWGIASQRQRPLITDAFRVCRY